MKKYDNMMWMFSFTAILVAVVSLAQGFDVVARYLNEEIASLELHQDEVIMRPGVFSNINVLANDIGLRNGDTDNLTITEQPKCGYAIVSNGLAEYMPFEECVGVQAFQYGLFGHGKGQVAEVIVTVRLGNPTQRNLATNAQRDIALPAPVEHGTPVSHITKTQMLTVIEGTAAFASVIIKPHSVIRPQVPVIVGLQDTILASDADTGPMMAGIALANPEPTPKMSAPQAAFTGAITNVSMPMVPQPDQEPNQRAVDTPSIETNPAPTVMTSIQAQLAGVKPTGELTQ